jgi:hypothetical protein
VGREGRKDENGGEDEGAECFVRIAGGHERISIEGASSRLHCRYRASLKKKYPGRQKTGHLIFNFFSELLSGPFPIE